MSARFSKSRKRRLRRQKLRNYRNNDPTVTYSAIKELISQHMTKKVMTQMTQYSNPTEFTQDSNIILLSIETHINNHSFSSYVNHIKEGILLMSPNDNTSIANEISKIVCHYIYNGNNPMKTNKSMYEFGQNYSKGSFGNRPYEYQRHSYTDLPEFEDFIRFILLSNGMACCPGFGPYPEPFKHLEHVVGDYGFRISEEQQLDIKQDEFIVMELGTNCKHFGSGWEAWVQRTELFDLKLNAKVGKIVLCELYHYSKIEQTDWCSPKGNEMTSHEMVGKIKYELENKNGLKSAFIYLTFHSAYYKYGYMGQRVIRQNWLDLFDVLPTDAKVDCYSYLNTSDWFWNKYNNKKNE